MIDYSGGAGLSRGHAEVTTDCMRVMKSRQGQESGSDCLSYLKMRRRIDKLLYTCIVIPDQPTREDEGRD